MTKDLAAEDARAIEALRTNARKILSYLSDRYRNSPVFNQWDEMADVLEATYAKRNLKGMRQINKDLRDWARDLPPDQLSELRSLGADV